MTPSSELPSSEVIFFVIRILAEDLDLRGTFVEALHDALEAVETRSHYKAEQTNHKGLSQGVESRPAQVVPIESGLGTDGLGPPEERVLNESARFVRNPPRAVGQSEPR